MGCTLKQVNEAITKLNNNNSDKARKAIEDLKGVRQQLLILSSEVVNSKANRVSPHAIVTERMLQDPEYAALVEQLDAVKAGKKDAIAKQQRAFENMKEKGGKGRAESATKAIEERTMLRDQLLEEIDYLRQEIADGAGKSVKEELKNTEEYLQLVEQQIAENKNIKKSSKTRSTREKNAVAAIKDSDAAKLVLYDKLNEFRRNYNTNTKLLENKLSDRDEKLHNLGMYLGIKTPNNSLALVEEGSTTVFSDIVNSVVMAGGVLANIPEAFRLMTYTENYIQKSIQDTLTKKAHQTDVGEASPTGFQGISALIYEGTPKNGKYSKKLPNEVATAMAVVINEWLANNSSLRWEQRTDADINRFLGRPSGTRVSTKDRQGLENVDFIRRTAAASIGANIVREIGLTTNDHKYSGILKDKIAVELGLIALNAMEQEGLISTGKKTKEAIFGEKGNTEELITIEFTDKAKKMMDHKSRTFQKATETASDAFGSTTKSSKPRINKYSTGRTHKNQSAQGEWLTTPAETQEILNKVENTAFSWDEEYVLDILNSYLEDPEGTKKYFGWKDPSTVHITKVKSVNGRNAAIERELDNMASLYKEMAENDNTEMFFDYFYGKNGRLYLDSSGFNPQNTKLHRFAVFTQSATITSDEDVDMYKLALLQAFGKDIDKQTMATSLKQWDEIVDTLNTEITDEKSAIDIANSLGKKGIHGHDPEHIIAGINEFRRLQKHGIKDIKGIESHLPLEVDAVTSGYILKTMQMPLIKEYDKHIEAGGIFTKQGDKYAFESFGEQVEDPDTLDAYLRPAKALIDKVIALYDKNGAGTSQSMMAALALGKSLKALKAGINSDKEEERKAALKKFRNLMKPPFIVFNYGAGMNAIIESIIYGDSKSDGAVENFYEMVMKAANGNQQAINAVKSYIKASATKYEQVYNKETKQNEWVVSTESDGFINSEIKRFEEAMDAETTTDKDGNTVTPGYKYELAPKLLDNLVSSLKSGLGVELENTFNETYAENIEANKVLNKSFTGMFKLFKARLDREIAAKQNELGRDITADEYTAVVSEISEFLPAIKHALAEENSDKLMVFNEAKQNYEALNNASIDGQGHVRSNKGDLSAYASRYALVEAAAAGAVIPIHFLDASIMVKALKNTDALNVFDAIMALPGEARNVAKDYNRVTIELSREYSLTTEMLNELTNAIENADKELLDTVNSSMDKDETIQQVLSDLVDLERSSVEGRKELFSKDIISEHLAIPGGAVEVKADKAAIITESKTNSHSEQANYQVRSLFDC